MSLSGACHCGNVRVELETDRAPAELPARACSCSFCRPRATRWTADTNGRVIVSVADPADLSRYRFGTRTADFLVCRRCGVCCAAVCEVDGRSVAVVNIAVLERGEEFPAPTTTDFDGESTRDRLARRARNWMPARVDEG